MLGAASSEDSIGGQSMFPFVSPGVVTYYTETTYRKLVKQLWPNEAYPTVTKRIAP